MDEKQFEQEFDIFFKYEILIKEFCIQKLKQLDVSYNYIDYRVLNSKINKYLICITYRTNVDRNCTYIKYNEFKEWYLTNYGNGTTKQD